MPQKKKKKAVLSKSTFIKGLQCPKALYLYKNRYFLRDPVSPEQRAKFNRGTNVGVYARDLFPGGVDASPKTHFQMAQSVEKTAALIEEGQTDVIYEAAFSFEDVVVALDILYRENGQWKGMEVKSSRKISDTYRWDAALQYYVISGSGLELKDFSIAYINKDYVRQGDINIHNLFITESLLSHVKKLKHETGEKISQLKEVAALKKSPDIPIGTQCHSPYPCEFIGHCWKKIPRDSVLKLQGIPGEQKFEWHHQGLQSAGQVYDQLENPADFQKQMESIEKGETVADKGLLTQFMTENPGREKIYQSAYFAPVVPLFDQTSPYQHLPFAVFSTPVEHFNPQAHLVKPGMFPAKEITGQLAQINQEADTIWVFDASYEKSILEFLRQFVPDQSELIQNFISKLKDMGQAFEKGYVIKPSFIQPDTPEKILQHLGQEPQELPPKIIIPQQADALYQKLWRLEEVEEKHEGVNGLTTYVVNRGENLFRLFKLLKTLSV